MPALHRGRQLSVLPTQIRTNIHNKPSEKKTGPEHTSTGPDPYGTAQNHNSKRLLSRSKDLLNRRIFLLMMPVACRGHELLLTADVNLRFGAAADDYWDLLLTPQVVCFSYRLPTQRGRSFNSAGRFSGWMTRASGLFVMVHILRVPSKGPRECGRQLRYM